MGPWASSIEKLGCADGEIWAKGLTVADQGYLI